jgi:AraC family transcriptional regulator
MRELESIFKIEKKKGRIQKMRKEDTGIDSIEPRIVDFKEPIKIIGLSIDTNVKSVYRDIPRLGKQFNKLKKKFEIPNKIKPWGFAAVGKDYNEEKKTWTYIMGDVVTSFDEIPEGMISFEIPAIKYAVFPIRPKNRFAWRWAISKMKKYIYLEWLPNSKYKQARVIDDFEYHDERSIRKKNPEIDLYVAIKEKI